MAKPTDRAYSHYALDALALLGRLIRMGRIDHRMTAEDLAQRAGISRGLLHRIERGDPGAAIGAVLETAAIVGVPLFEADRGAMAERIRNTGERLTLLPKAVRPAKTPVRDDF